MLVPCCAELLVKVDSSPCGHSYIVQEQEGIEILRKMEILRC